MRDILRRHAGRSLFGIVLILCALRIATLKEADEQLLARGQENIDKLKQLLVDPQSVVNYPYVVSKLKYDTTFGTAHSRISLDIDTPARRIAYPRLSPPKIDPKTLPYPADERHVQVCAATVEAGIRAAQGRLLLGITVPPQTTLEMAVEKTDRDGKKNIVIEKVPLVTVVSAEIFRGLSADTIDTRIPYAKLDLETELSKNDPRAKLIPPEFTSVRVFEDTHVDPQTAYFYRVRLVTRVDMALDKFLIEKDPQNPEKLRKTMVHIAPGVEILPPEAHDDSKGVLLASALSNPISETTPAEYKFRFIGMNGEFSSPEAKPHEIRQDYAARFETHVWVNHAQEWRSVLLEVTKGQPLKGSVHGRNQPKRYEFDSHRQLEEVVWRTEMINQQIEETIKDPDDETQLVKKVNTVQVPSLPFKVAIVKDLTTGKLEEYREGRDIEKPDERARTYILLAELQKEHRPLVAGH
jgi:hypothetical protein